MDPWSSFCHYLLSVCYGHYFKYVPIIAGELKSTQKGKLDSNWVIDKDTSKIAKLEIVEFLQRIIK
jgi:hypothetical protein